MSDDVDRPPPGPSGIEADAPGGTTPWLVRSVDLARMRRLVTGAAGRAGLSPDGAHQFTLAVNEIVINAIRYAGGLASVAVAATAPTGERSGQITVTVVDNGPGFDNEVTADPPPVEQVHGRGLWLAHRMCDDIEIDSSPRGTVVRLRASSSAA